MPQIPTNTSGPTLLGAGAQNTETDARPFGSQIGHAMEKVGDDINRTTVIAGNIVERQKAIDANTWANDSMTQLRDFYTDWMANDENHSKESFAEDFKRMAQKSMNDYEAKAPNEIARLQFREQFQRFENSHYAAAVTTTAQTRVSNMIESHNGQNNSVIGAYEKHRLIPNLDANTELLGDMQERFNSIDAAFGKVAPGKASQLKAQLAEDAAYAAMRYSPVTARKVLAMSTGILEQRRIHAIESQIETAENANHALDIETVNTMLNNRVDFAEGGGQPAKFVLSDIPSFIPRDKAQALINQKNAEIEVYNTANLHIDKLQPWSGPAQVKYLQALEERSGKVESEATRDKHILRMVANKVSSNMTAYDKDPAGYLLSNNKALQGINDHIQELSKDDKNAAQIQQKYAERDTLMLQLQGLPPEGLSEEVANQYSPVNRSQLKVMSDAEAKQSVRRINESSPKEALNAIRSVTQRHSKHSAIAFNNLVQLQHGDGIRGDYWLVYKNQDNPDVTDLVGAIQQQSAGKTLNKEILTEVDKTLDSNPTWMAFKSTFPSDNFQMEGMTAGIRSGLVSYAVVRSQKVAPEIAVNEAVEKFLNKPMAMVDVGGQTVVMDREGRSDPEMAEIGRRLNMLPRVLNTQDIKTTDDLGNQLFPVVFGPGGPGNDNTKIEQLRNIIVDRGYFKPSNDNKAATLYIRSDTGSPFEARTKDGRAISVLLNEVEDVSEAVTFHSGESGEPYTVMFPPRIKPIFGTRAVERPVLTPEQMKDDRFRSYRKYTTVDTVSYTNWPVEPKFIRRVEAAK